MIIHVFYQKSYLILYSVLYLLNKFLFYSAKYVMRSSLTFYPGNLKRNPLFNILIKIIFNYHDYYFNILFKRVGIQFLLFYDIMCNPFLYKKNNKNCEFLCGLQKICIEAEIC